MLPEDVPAAQLVEEKCFSQPWTTQMFYETLSLPYAAYYVAETENETSGKEIVGISGVRMIFGEGEITNVAVLPSARGNRIAYRILKQLISEARENDTEEFTLEVRKGNAPAIRTYEKLGFKTEGIRPGFYENPREDALIMWLRREKE